VRFAFFGSSIVSSYWNGACTYYRGIVRGLHARGHEVTFYEPHAYERQEHRDIPDPGWTRVRVYEPTDAHAVLGVVREARDAEVVVKCSGVGAFDELLEEAVLELTGTSIRIFWDVDAPATLASMESDPNNSLRRLIGSYDLVLTYGGGDPVVQRYHALGARMCVPVYNGLDPDVHRPAPADPRFAADLSFLGNRLPDRERRVEEFFFRATGLAPDRSFLLGGNGWNELERVPNLRYVGHVSPADHNAFNCSALAVLNVSRESMADNGFSPATRVFEAAGAGACLITDQWEGLELFLEPGSEVLVARDGEEVASHLNDLSPESARRMGEAARQRVLAEHTYRQRAELVESILDGAAVAS
jgi:spore maturation protein CgeB